MRMTPIGGAQRLAPALCVGLMLAAAAPVALASESARPKPKRLPPATLHGPEDRLRQYPTPKLATPVQRAAAEALLAELRAAAEAWRPRRNAIAAGFGTRARPHRRQRDHSVLYFHAERRALRAARSYLDPRRPKALIYADAPGRPLALVGAMFSVPRGVSGPTPGGPITRWHTHRVCANGRNRGLTPLRDGSCPAGTRARQGSEMLHVWFTKDLRSAFAIHAPRRELCAAGLLPRGHCRAAGLFCPIGP